MPTIGDHILMALGQYRDEMSPEAVKAFQQIAAMRSKDHSIAVDDVRVLTALLDYSDGAFIPMEPAVRQAITAAITVIGSQSIEGERAK